MYKIIKKLLPAWEYKKIDCYLSGNIDGDQSFVELKQFLLVSPTILIYFFIRLRRKKICPT